MAIFSYRAVDASGKVIRGRLPAVNAHELEGRLRNNGLEILDLSQLSTAGLWPSGGVPRKELISLCFHMEQTLRGGAMVVDALQDLVDSIADRRMRDVLAMVLEAVREGATLSGAMAEFPRIFDKVFIGMVRAGETSGQLSEAFAKLGADLRWADELSSQLRKLILYPAFTAVVIACVSLFMLLYVVPQLAGFIRQTTGGAMPWSTRALLSMSEGLVLHWPWVLGAPVVGLAGAIFALSRAGERMRIRIDRLKLLVPVLGGVAERVALARFASLLGTLYGSGIPVLQSLDLCASAAGNRHIAEAIRRVAEEITAGCGLGEAFRRTGMFPNLVLRMVKVGESTGELDVALDKVGYFYNREIGESIGKVQVLVEPLMTVTLGLLLGWVMMAVLGPIYDLLGKLKV